MRPSPPRPSPDPDPLTPGPPTPGPVTPGPLTPGSLGPDRLTPDPLGPDRLTPDPLGPDRLTPDPLGPDRLTADSLGPDPLPARREADLEPEPGTPGPPRPSPDPKRVLDVTLGSVLLALAAPLLLAATIVTALRRPPGGVFVTDTRTGLGGRPFRLRRLRTRRFGLHVLSMLPHVVRGEMSLVGPAPLPAGDPAAHAPWRQSVRPGLTGPAQVRRASTLPWDEPLLLDQHYVEHQWIGLDLALLLRALRTPRSPRPPRSLRPPHRSRTVPGQAHLSDADHRVRGYSAAE